MLEARGGEEGSRERRFTYGVKENTKSFGLTEEDEMSATPLATMRKKKIIKVLRVSRCVFLVTYSLSSISNQLLNQTKQSNSNGQPQMLCPTLMYDILETFKHRGLFSFFTHCTVGRESFQRLSREHCSLTSFIFTQSYGFPNSLDILAEHDALISEMCSRRLALQHVA